MSFSSESRTTKVEAGLSGDGERATDLAAGGLDAGFSRAEIAGYLVDLISELSLLASTRRLDTVAYFLEMARIEASLVERKDC